MFRTIICCALTVIISIGAFAGQKTSNFAGEWTLDSEKSDVSNSQLFLAKIDIEVKGDSLLTARTYENEWGESYPFEEDVTLDGKEYNQTIYDMPRKAAAELSSDGANIIHNSTTTFYGDSGSADFSTKETWHLDQDGKVLAIDYESTWPEGEANGTLYYNKEKPGEKK